MQHLQGEGGPRIRMGEGGGVGALHADHSQ